MVQPYQQNLRGSRGDSGYSNKDDGVSTGGINVGDGDSRCIRGGRGKQKKVAAIATEEATSATTAEYQMFRTGQMIEAKGLMKIKAAETTNITVAETADERAERFKEGLESCLW